MFIHVNRFRLVILLRNYVYSKALRTFVETLYIVYMYIYVGMFALKLIYPAKDVEFCDGFTYMYMYSTCTKCTHVQNVHMYKMYTCTHVCVVFSCCLNCVLLQYSIS